MLFIVGQGEGALALRSDSYPDPAGIDTRTRYVEEEKPYSPYGRVDRRTNKIADEDAKLFFSTMRNMADVYRYFTEPGTGATITDPRVERSWGGGMMPEQHWGYLKDGQCFYLRLRHAHASLQLGPAGLDPNVDLPITNPEWRREEFEAALDAGEPYPHTFWLMPRPEVNVYPEDDWVGNFRTEEDLQHTFTLLLDMILNEPTGTGWCAPSP